VQNTEPYLLIPKVQLEKAYLDVNQKNFPDTFTFEIAFLETPIASTVKINELVKAGAPDPTPIVHQRTHSDLKREEKERKEALSQREKELENRDWTLREILELPEALNRFLGFSHSLYSVENVFFWIDLDRYKTEINSSNNGKLSEYGKAFDLYNKYIRVNSPFQVNIAASECLPYIKFFEQDPKTAGVSVGNKEGFLLFCKLEDTAKVFEPLRVIVLRLLRDNVYTPFLKSDHYLKLRKEFGPLPPSYSSNLEV